MIFLHESPAPLVDQSGSFAAHRFGDEEVFCRGMIEAGGVKLHEFQVGQFCARPIGYGKSVSRRNVWIAGIEVDLSRAPGAKQHGMRHKGVNLFSGYIEHIGAPARILLVAGRHEPVFIDWC